MNPNSDSFTKFSGLYFRLKKEMNNKVAAPLEGVVVQVNCVCIWDVKQPVCVVMKDRICQSRSLSLSLSLSETNV
ncbi:hypothetical protein HanRHA438_Chr04g0165891 [Helianthus annuus]|nr:hypothetical protein HanRHA438_Chr04g0165891 [Helianthus annuus]